MSARNLKRKINSGLANENPVTLYFRILRHTQLMGDS